MWTISYNDDFRVDTTFDATTHFGDYSRKWYYPADGQGVAPSGWGTSLCSEMIHTNHLPGYLDLSLSTQSTIPWESAGNHACLLQPQGGAAGSDPMANGLIQGPIYTEILMVESVYQVDEVQYCCGTGPYGNPNTVDMYISEARGNTSTTGTRFPNSAWGAIGLGPPVVTGGLNSTPNNAPVLMGLLIDPDASTVVGYYNGALNGTLDPSTGVQTCTPGQFATCPIANIYDTIDWGVNITCNNPCPSDSDWQIYFFRKYKGY